MTTQSALHERSEHVINDDCIFCRREDGTLNVVVLESSNFYVRRDNFPATAGHVEIVPKRHVVSFFELTPDDVAEAYDLMSQIKSALADQLEPDGYTIGINDGRAAGRTIDHLHIHLIPRRFGDVADPTGGIRQVLPNNDCSRWLEPQG